MRRVNASLSSLSSSLLTVSSPVCLQILNKRKGWKNITFSVHALVSEHTCVRPTIYSLDQKKSLNSMASQLLKSVQLIFDHFIWKFRRKKRSKNFLISETFTGKVTSICAKKRRLNKLKNLNT